MYNQASLGYHLCNPAIALASLKGLFVELKKRLPDGSLISARLSAIIILLLFLFVFSAAPCILAADVFSYYEMETGEMSAEAGFGAEQREPLEKAVGAIRAGRLSEGEALLDQTLSSFRGEMVDPNKVYVSVASRSQLEQFKKESAGEKQVIWLDLSFDHALSLKAFIKSAQREASEALRILDEEIRIAPYSAAPYVERGFIFNRQKKPGLGLQSYETALKLARSYESSKRFEAAALRGMSFSLIDLGDLDKAESLLKESLTVEPGNTLAQKELEYIRHLRASKR